MPSLASVLLEIRQQFVSLKEYCIFLFIVQYDYSWFPDSSRSAIPKIGSRIQFVRDCLPGPDQSERRPQDRLHLLFLLGIPISLDSCCSITFLVAMVHSENRGPTLWPRNLGHVSCTVLRSWWVFLSDYLARVRRKYIWGNFQETSMTKSLTKPSPATLLLRKDPKIRLKWIFLNIRYTLCMYLVYSTTHKSLDHKCSHSGNNFTVSRKISRIRLANRVE